MKKIVIQPIQPIKTEKSKYLASAERFRSFNEEVAFTMSGIVPQFLLPGDEVKLITIAVSPDTEKGKEDVKKNIENCHDEYSVICEMAGVDFTAEDIAVPGDVNNTHFDNMFSQIIGMIDEGSEIFVDCTFGERIIPLFLFSVVQFAEQCLGCKLKVMTVSKQKYDDKGERIKGSQTVADITSIYYLSKIISTLHSTDSKKAIKTVQNFLAL